MLSFFKLKSKNFNPFKNDRHSNASWMIFKRVEKRLKRVKKNRQSVELNKIVFADECASCSLKKMSTQLTTCIVFFFNKQHNISIMGNLD